MTAKEFYQEIHGDYEDMFARIPSDELIMSFVKQFLLDQTYEKLMTAIQDGDIKASFEAAHNLKGLVSNLSFSEMLVAVSALVDQLRSQMKPADALLVQKVSEQYHIVTKAIQHFEFMDVHNENT